MERSGRENRGLLVVLAASVVSSVLGSIHAFSVFLGPLEAFFSQSRSAVALTYSLALVSLTCAVLLGPRIYARWSGAVFVIVACGLAATGALIAASSQGLWGLWTGYSLVFGAANGLGYGYGLQISGQANPGREGLAMGTVTGAYALGAIIAPRLFEIAVTSSFALAMVWLAVALIAAGVVAGCAMWLVDARYASAKASASENTGRCRAQALLWIAYFGGVLAGLMVIGHAAGIWSWLSDPQDSWLAPMLIAGSNLAGCLIAGQLADRWSMGGLMSALGGVTLAGLGLLAFVAGPAGLVAGLGLIGFAYGGTIAVCPAAVAKIFGLAHSARVYGRVFTAWGCAGLLGPWLAGALFDYGGGYQLAFYAAACCVVISLVALSALFRDLESGPKSMKNPPM